MSGEILDDRAPGKWVSSCQRCLNYLYLDEKEYTSMRGYTCLIHRVYWKVQQKS